MYSPGKVTVSKCQRGTYEGNLIPFWLLSCAQMFYRTKKTSVWTIRNTHVRKLRGCNTSKAKSALNTSNVPKYQAYEGFSTDRFKSQWTRSRQNINNFGNIWAHNSIRNPIQLLRSHILLRIGHSSSGGVPYLLSVSRRSRHRLGQLKRLSAVTTVIPRAWCLQANQLDCIQLWQNASVIKE